MDTFLVDEGLRGVISALYFAFTLRRTPKKIECEKTYIPCPDDLVFTLRTSEQDVKRVERALIKYSGISILNDMKICLCYDNESPYLAVFNYASAVLSARRDLKNELSYPDVWEFYSRLNEVKSEVSKTIKTLVFRNSPSGTLLAEYCPNNDITRLLLPSLFKQYPKKAFILHDLRRGIIGISNGKQLYCESADMNFGFSANTRQKRYNEISLKYSFNKN